MTGGVRGEPVGGVRGEEIAGMRDEAVPGRPVGAGDAPHRVTVADRGAVRVITLDRPEARNAFDAAMYRALLEALVSARIDSGVRVAVLTGAAPAFSAGQDLHEMAALATGTGAPGLVTGFPALLDELATTDLPIVGAVNGAAVGLGLTMLPYLDVVLVAQGARARVPFAELGVPPEAASSLLLARRLGWSRAAHALLCSAWISAEEMVEGGLALRASPPMSLVDDAVEIASAMAGASRSALGGIKRLMRAAEAQDIAAARRREDEAFALLFADPERNPGASLASGLGGGLGGGPS